MNWLLNLLVLLALIPVYVVATGPQLRYLELREVKQVVGNINDIYGVDGVSVGVFSPLAYLTGGSANQGKLLNTTNALIYRVPHSRRPPVSRDTLEDKFYGLVLNTRFEQREVRVNKLWNSVNNKYPHYNTFVSVSGRQYGNINLTPIIASNARGSIDFSFPDAQDYVVIVLN